MLAVYLCLISVLTPFVSSKISLLSFGGKTYLNGQYIVEAPDNGNIQDGIVNGYTQKLKLNIIKSLTLPERLILVDQLKKSNDILSQREAENVKRLEDRENELDKLFKGEEQQQLKNLTNDEVPQEAISHGKFEEMPGRNKITEVKGVEDNSRMMRYTV
ncbi:uncharacterized protein LOC113558719 [Rhopalosiphum maidis]|uniref:uncharacterized protein LOC113558719 n=1 Tax=Rhopalosiphum maidis TaxID=43146 RepID=UPI000F00E43C|nr:uncharacterized protein LOC113558719 [Rhopalosiphum maidis]